jgi:predicted amidohydrolase
VHKFRIALAQLQPRLFDKEANLQKAEMAIRSAASEGASVILFPELFLTGYSLGDRAREFAETSQGSSIQRVSDLARANRIAVLMGYAELNQDGQGVHDAVFVVDSEGTAHGSYRKVHLFHAEKATFIAGNEAFVVDFGLGRIGVLICYDLEFPEAARQLALQGAQWLATCTGNMKPNQHTQKLFTQARAAENRLWVAVANRIGREGEFEFFGGSSVADPRGELAAEANSQEIVLSADIDLSLADRARQNADYLADRRPALYGRITER